MLGVTREAAFRQLRDRALMRLREGDGRTCAGQLRRIRTVVGESG
jgi:hypothetical protein